VVDLEKITPKPINLIGLNQNEEVGFAHLLSLLAFITKRIQGNEPLVYYSNSHVVTLS
jgi:hypothetical protein